MSPSENDTNAKRSNFRPQPLCLFYFPQENSINTRKSCANTLEKEPEVRITFAREKVGEFIRKHRDVKNKQKEDFWLRKRTEARIKRRRMKEPSRNPQTYLLTSEKNENVSQKKNLPSLFEVLEIVKDAWPSPASKKKFLFGQEKQIPTQFQTSKPEMKNQKVHPAEPLHRRFSVPEELMRKFLISKERTSEESETNKTTIEKSPSSSSLEMTETVRKPTAKETQQETKAGLVTTDAYQQTSDSEQPKKSKFSKRVTQYDYYNHGKQVIKVKVEKECTCRREENFSTTGSPKEETDESGTTDSLPSSSPVQLPKRESSSGNLSSSDSDYVRCTCAELTSTSTDLFRSGKSTLSQTITDKSVSTQDSTVSINSVSTRGSTASDNSNSTTPEKKTSAKETTTSPDYTPRMARNRKNKKWYHDHKKTCPRHVRSEHSKCQKLCPVHSEFQHGNKVNTAANTDYASHQQTKKEIDLFKHIEARGKQLKAELPQRCEWARLSREELYMMQQLRHRRFVENQKLLIHGLLSTPDAYSLSLCESDTTEKQTENIDEIIMIPRYSALPRTLSMLVNTSSPDTSHNSDSDNQSLADSLEDQPITHVHKLYFDTKKESKPVRGDASVILDNKPKPRQKAMPKGRAFFVSIKDPYGEDEMLESIEKIPQPPEKIKNQIFKRHLNLCSKRQQVHENKTKANETTLKNKKEKSKGEVAGTKKIDRNCENKSKGNVKGKKDKSRSKIPVLASSRSTSTSPETKPKEKVPRPKIRLRREKKLEELTAIPKADIETTQILEITQTTPQIILQKPQAVIHPSVEHSAQLTIPPLTSTLETPSSRQFNNHFLLPPRRSPIGKFRQRFEVIPEEKSSSLSSAEEKNPNEILPKFADATTSPVSSEKFPIKNYVVNDVSNMIVADFSKNQLETFPYVNNHGQKIFLFSKSQNSTKGRDALIAMNREDFKRLAKGWMNFYKLNEFPDNSENECKTHIRTTEKEPENPTEKKPKESELEEPVKLHSSNTILKAKSVAVDRGKNPRTQTSLPESELSEAKDPLKSNSSRDDESDSDSTDYMEPPSPRVPPLPIGDIPSDATLSSDESELDESRPRITTQMLKDMECKKRTTNSKLKAKNENLDSFRCGKKRNSGWSVTVAGTVELSRSAPDLEMRLSFPVKAGLPAVAQSDSGFAEDFNCSKLSQSLQDLKLYTTRQAFPLSTGNRKQQWTVMVKNQKKRQHEQCHQSIKNLPPPILNCDRNGKKNFKDALLENKLKRIVERKIWPKVKQVIRKEFLTGSGRIFTEVDLGDDESCLSVTGSAVSLERRQKPATTREKDVTMRHSSRIEEH